MSDLAWFYVVMLVVFRVADHIAGAIADSPKRPVAAWVVAMAWPVMAPLALIAAAALYKKMKGQGGVQA